MRTSQRPQLNVEIQTIELSKKEDGNAAPEQERRHLRGGRGCQGRGGTKPDNADNYKRKPKPPYHRLSERTRSGVQQAAKEKNGRR